MPSTHTAPIKLLIGCTSCIGQWQVCLATSAYFRGQSRCPTAVETTRSWGLGTERKRTDVGGFHCKMQSPTALNAVLYAMYSCKYQTLGSALCALVDNLGVSPTIFRAVTPQHCTQQSSERWGAWRIDSHIAK